MGSFICYTSTELDIKLFEIKVRNRLKNKGDAGVFVLCQHFGLPFPDSPSDKGFIKSIGARLGTAMGFGGGG